MRSTLAIAVLLAAGVACCNGEITMDKNDVLVSAEKLESNLYNLRLEAGDDNPLKSSLESTRRNILEICTPLVKAQKQLDAIQCILSLIEFPELIRVVPHMVHNFHHVICDSFPIALSDKQVCIGQFTIGNIANGFISVYVETVSEERRLFIVELGRYLISDPVAAIKHIFTNYNPDDVSGMVGHDVTQETLDNTVKEITTFVKNTIIAPIVLIGYSAGLVDISNISDEDKINMTSIVIRNYARLTDINLVEEVKNISATRLQFDYLQ